MKKYKGKISIKFIKQIHYALTFNILKEQAGRFRSIRVYMGGSKHTPTSPPEVDREMQDLMRWISSHKKLHPAILAAYTHHFLLPFILLLTETAGQVSLIAELYAYESRFSSCLYPFEGANHVH